MGFDSARSGDSSRSDATRGRTSTSNQNASESTVQRRRRSASAGPTRSGRPTREQAERYYGVKFDSRSELERVQRMERQYGQHLFEWLDEGIPLDAIGSPANIQRYRKRQGSPVPWDIEEFNERSERRNVDVQRSNRGGSAGETDVPDSVRDVISSPGRSLDSGLQRAMEDRIGGSFGDVRVHTGPRAARACEAIDARAFTVGSHVAFNHGEYEPSSAEGQHVIAHELAHVRQQTGGGVSMLPQADVELEVDPDEELEREAEETARRVMEGSEPGIVRLADSDVHLQRSPDGRDEQIFSATRDGKTIVLNRGTRSKGWKHIRGRHIEGTLDTDKQTSFFPVGQSIERGGRSVTLDPEISESDVQMSIKKAIEIGTEDPDDPADVYVLESNSHGFTLGDIRVITGLQDDVITAYPVEGPQTPTWKPTTGWENV